jgi:hypothetical protein
VKNSLLTVSSLSPLPALPCFAPAWSLSQLPNPHQAKVADAETVPFLAGAAPAGEGFGLLGTPVPASEAANSGGLFSLKAPP